jgi:tRNA dimethylallyltransferase
LELWEATGRLPSVLRPALWDAPQVPLSGFLVLTRPREELAGLIEGRSVRMWEAGLLDEVRGLLAAGVAPDTRSLQSIGYRQAVAVLAGRLSLAEAQRDLVRATRQYAKRQLTWFRREPAAEWITVSGAAWLEPLVEQLAARLTTSAQAGSGARLGAGEER